MPTKTQPTSPDDGRTRRQIAAATSMTAIVVMAVAFLFFVNPTSVVFLPRCPLYMTTGLYCPGCGATRAAYEILHGNWLAALRLNALFTLSLPCLVAFGLYRWAASRWGWRGVTVYWESRLTWLLLAVILVFGIVRNVPTYPFTLLRP